MALKGYVLPTREIGLPGGDKFAVRGLAFPDILMLVERHGAPLAHLFARYAGSEVEMPSLDEVGDIGKSILTSSPKLAAEIIALAADEPEEVELIQRLPFPIQVEALDNIGQLTFDVTGGPKKVIETVIRILGGTADLMGDLRTSKAGSLASAGK